MQDVHTTNTCVCSNLGSKSKDLLNNEAFVLCYFPPLVTAGSGTLQKDAPLVCSMC